MTAQAGDASRQPAPARRSLAGVTRPGALAVTVLVALPVLTFSVPALAGHPFVSGDNLIQNFPLRVLVGRNLDQGHLPLWNPYIWSGTALLGGLNAGAFYPGTLLFAVLPSVAAWVVNQILVYVAGGVGLYVFLRRCRLSVGAGFLGSLTFVAGGFLSAQLSHIDLVQGASLIPWMLVALQAMAPPGAAAAGRTSAPGAAKPPVIWPTVLLGAGFSLLVLTGSPEAVIDNSIVAVIYGGWLAWRHRAGRIVLQLAIAAGSALVLTAVQWLPGLVFAANSQRSGTSYSFFVSGSLSPKLTALTVMPYLLGGYGRFGVPLYHGLYNLAEVSSYMGILPLCATFALLTRPWRARRRSDGWGVWYLVIAVGLVLSFGGYTPLGHLLVHIPVYGQQRLQNRNLVMVDLALAVLVAYWIDGVRRRARGDAAPTRPTRAERTWTLVPVACLLGLAGALVASPVVVSQELGSPVPLGSFHRLEGYLVAGFLVAVAGSLVAAGWDRIPRRRLLQVLSAVVVIDLALYGANQYWLTAPPRSALTDSTGMARAIAARTGPSGRFAIYDPAQASTDPVPLNDLGQPDLNVLRSLSSVQGYGSVVSGDYERATGAHEQLSLSVAALAGTTFDELNLTTLVTRPGYFTVAVPPGSSGSPPAATPTRLDAGGQQGWFLGAPLRLTGVSLRLRPEAGCPLPPGALGLGLLTPGGTTTWLPGALAPGAGGGADAVGMALDGTLPAVGTVVRNASGCPVTVEAAMVTTSSSRLALAGPLQAAVTPPKWQFTEVRGDFVLFRNTAAKGRFWVTGADGGPVPGATVRVLDDPATGGQKVLVQAPRPALVVRSVAAAPGWLALVSTGQPARTGERQQPGPAREVPVVSAGATGAASGGLVQGVRVPAGTSTVTWRYRPASVTAGLYASLAGVVALVALGLAWSLRGPARRALRRGAARPRGDPLRSASALRRLRSSGQTAR